MSDETPIKKRGRPSKEELRERAIQRLKLQQERFEKGERLIEPEVLDELDLFDKPLTAKDARAARYLYCVQGLSIETVAIRLKKKERNIRSLVSRRGWEKLRHRLDHAIIRKAFQANEKEFKEVIGLSTEILKRFFVFVLKGNAFPTFKEAKLVSDVASNYFRLFQVIQGKASDIKRIEQAGEMTADELRLLMEEVAKEVNSDPMAKLPAPEEKKNVH